MDIASFSRFSRVAKRLGAARVVADGDGVTVQAWGGGVDVLSVPVDGSGSGSVNVDSRALESAGVALSAGRSAVERRATVTVHVDGDVVSVSGAGRTVQVPHGTIVPADAAWDVPPVGDDVVTLARADLSAAMSRAVPGSVSGAYPVLGFVQVALDAVSPQLVLTSTDRYRMAREAVETISRVGDMGPLLVPHDACVRVLSVMRGDTVSLSTVPDGRGGTLPNIRVASGAVVAVVRQIYASYPKVDRFWRDKPVTTVEVDARALWGEVKAAGASSKIVVLSVGEGSVSVAPPGLSGPMAVPAAVEGGPIELALSPAYLSALLSHVGKGNVRLGFVAPDKPVTATAEGLPSWRHVLMTMRLGSSAVAAA